MMGIFRLEIFLRKRLKSSGGPSGISKGSPGILKDYEKFSPSNHIKNFKTPCLIITGERGLPCSIHAIATVLYCSTEDECTIEASCLLYAGHWPSWYEMALYYTAHLEWFSKYLGGAPPPWTTEQFLRNSVFDPESGNRITK